MSHRFKYNALALFLSLAMGCATALAAYAGTETNVYDDLGRLKKVEYDDGTALVYDYDEVGNRLSKNYITTLSVTYDGPGSGTAVANPAYGSCGEDCFEVNVGLPFTLTPIPVGWSVFSNWTGIGCSGPGECNTSITTPSSVNATFGVCTNIPVRIGGGTPVYFNSLQEAYDAAADGAVIQSGWSRVEGNLYINRNISVTFEGGYSCDYSAVTGVTTLVGEVFVTNGSSVMGDIEVVSPDYSLKAIKSGNGNGGIQFSLTGAQCGADCYIYTSPETVTLTASSDSNSLFTGWSDPACPGTGTCTVAVNSMTDVTANFTLKTFSLTASKTGSGTGTVTSAPAGINCGADCSEVYNINTSVTLTATPDSNSLFTGWSGGGCSGTGTCTVTMDTAKAVTANFNIKTFTLTAAKTGNGAGTVTSAPAGISCGADCNQVYNIGTSVTLTATPDSNSLFTGWSGGGCSGTGTCTVTMDAAKTVTANFNLKTFTLTLSKNGTGTGTVTSAPAGINCGADCSEVYNINTTVTLTATASANSLFMGWSGGGCSGTGTCVVTMTAAKTVTATFNRNDYPVKISGGVLTYNTIQEAYNAAATGNLIMIQAASFTETISINRNINVTLRGGYNSDFSAVTGNSTVNGNITINNGNTVIENLVIQ